METVDNFFSPPIIPKLLGTYKTPYLQYTPLSSGHVGKGVMVLYIHRKEVFCIMDYSDFILRFGELLGALTGFYIVTLTYFSISSSTSVVCE